jgi:hypothetical protein
MPIKAPELGTYWTEAADAEPMAFAMYRRHYSAQKNKNPKSRGFVGVGEKMVLIGLLSPALFAWKRSTIPRDDGQEGVNCSVFRNESDILSSTLILEAMEWAWLKWPRQRLFTMVDPSKIRSINPGCCFKKAGWRRCGVTKRGLIILECHADQG